MADLVLPHHLDVFRKHIEESAGILMVRYAPDHTIVAASEVFTKQIPNNGNVIGESVHDFMCDPDGRDCSLLATSHSELPISFTVQLKPTGSTYLCGLYADESGFILVGEILAESEDEKLQRMSLMTNELANLTRELRQRNTELELANQTIRELTRVDPLTGLANRRHFAEALDTAMTFARRHEQPLSLISIDIDRFKSINDTYGHDGGDEVLRRFSDILRESCRNEDLPVRLGGEEFLVLLPNTIIDEAFTLAERLRQRMSKTVFFSGGRNVTASFGLTQLTEGDNYFNFMKRADMALYEAKTAGRNKTVVRMISDVSS